MRHKVQNGKSSNGKVMIAAIIAIAIVLVVALVVIFSKTSVNVNGNGNKVNVGNSTGQSTTINNDIHADKVILSNGDMTVNNTIDNSNE